jgi:mersacidin/lichenicidin family type 2 lantibiotic
MTVDIARAWSNPEYRKSLTPEELAALPPNPAGDPALTPEDLATVSGGGTSTKPVCKGQITISGPGCDTEDNRGACDTFQSMCPTIFCKGKL